MRCRELGAGGAWGAMIGGEGRERRGHRDGGVTPVAGKITKLARGTRGRRGLERLGRVDAVRRVLLQFAVQRDVGERTCDRGADAVSRAQAWQGLVAYGLDSGRS